MSGPQYHDLYPNSPAYQGMQPLRIPAGWMIGWNTLDVGMETDREGIGGSSLFYASNEGRRFNIDIEYRPEFDPEGSFQLTVGYQPWPRNERGKRIKDAPFAFTVDAELIHAFETRSYAALIAELEHWIARCTAWQREGN